ncbi:hypothetical protein MIT9_P1343 [Methylomarinovum caldicuralii]|uniref:Uncharacterized protein n=1 Tax=Methylomarinovum caldicuralii TaxID=438856 RepID=A0AAU9C2E1_9GAMM|nr:hydrogenase/urease maturation nickel metallochaperone HypA [Methylomarinovum caldicuralii]BCX81763.1 hypothetical protein MIT9_P1343 [Methylomarinovum caldicuralii]
MLVKMCRLLVTIGACAINGGIPALRNRYEAEAERQGFSRVERVGALSCVEPEALCFCFDAVTAGSIAEGAVPKMRLQELEVR